MSGLHWKLYLTRVKLCNVVLLVCLRHLSESGTLAMPQLNINVMLAEPITATEAQNEINLSWQIPRNMHESVASIIQPLWLRHTSNTCSDISNFG